MLNTKTRSRLFSHKPTRPGCALCLDTGHHAYRGGDPVAFFLPPPRADPLPALEKRRPPEAGMGRARAHPLRHRRRQRHVLRARSRARSTSSPFATPFVKLTTTAGRPSSRTCTPRPLTSRFRSPSEHSNTCVRSDSTRAASDVTAPCERFDSPLKRDPRPRGGS